MKSENKLVIQYFRASAQASIRQGGCRRTATLGAAVLMLAMAACTAEPDANESFTVGEGEATELLDDQQNTAEPNAELAGQSGTTAQMPSMTADELRVALFGENDAGVPTFGVPSERILADCMKEAGFEYTPDAIVDDEELNDSANEGGPGGPWSVEFARDEGYGILVVPPGSEDTASTGVDGAPNLRYYESLTPAERAAFNQVFSGTPTSDGAADPESCLGRYEALMEELSLNGDFVDMVLDEVQTLIDSDKAVVEAREQWRACMSKNGYDYADRDEIVEYLFALDDANGNKLATAAQQDEERAIAVSDVECSETELVATAAAMADAQQTVIDEYANDG